MKVESSAGVTRTVAVCAAIGVLFALWVVLAEGRAAAADRLQFRWSAALESPEIGETTLEAIVLDSAIFAATGADLADVRLRDAQGVPVAFVLRQTPTT